MGLWSPPAAGGATTQTLEGWETALPTRGLGIQLPKKGGAGVALLGLSREQDPGVPKDRGQAGVGLREAEEGLRDVKPREGRRE